jgi:hypothetical protein
VSDLPSLRGCGLKVAIGASGLVHDGAGAIRIREGAVIHGIDKVLWRWLILAADELRVAIYISSGDSGTHVPNSRHYLGLAVDISRIGRPGGTLEPVTIQNGLAVQFAAWTLSHGFRARERVSNKSVAGILFGPAGYRWNPSQIDHSDHIHWSILRPPK